MAKKISAFLLFCFLFTISMSGLAATQNIVEIAVGNESFSTLVAALQKAELVDALTGDGPFTVFAPTDDAFAKLLSQLNISATDLLNHPQLSDVLLYHVVSGKVMSTDLSEGLEAETLNGEKIKVSLMDGVSINDSKVTTADIEATNGVIHVIDTVLVPASFQLSPSGAVPQTGSLGFAPYFLSGAFAASGLLILRKIS